MPLPYSRGSGLAGARHLDTNRSGPENAARMKLYSGKIDSIATEIIARLQRDGDIEVSDVPEAELDVGSVLKE